MLINAFLDFWKNMFYQGFVCICESVRICIRFIRILNFLCCENGYSILDNGFPVKCYIFYFVGKFVNIDTFKFCLLCISKDIRVWILFIPRFYICRGNSNCGYSRFWINGLNAIKKNANNFIYLCPVCDPFKLCLFCICIVIISMHIIFICDIVMLRQILFHKLKSLFFFEVTKPIGNSL